jgi:hypothetical protein
MSHARQQIREAAAAAVTGLATTGSRVYQSRVIPLGEAKLPCLLVNTDDEDIEVTSYGSGVAGLGRSLMLTIRAVAKASANVDDTLDTMTAEVETALGSSTLGLLKSLALEGIGIDFDEAEKTVGIATLRYRAYYMTLANAPAAAL